MHGGVKSDTSTVHELEIGKVMMWKWKLDGEAEEQEGVAVIGAGREASTAPRLAPLPAQSTSSSSSAAAATRFFSPSPHSYKLEAAAHFSQSVFNAAACLIIVSLTQLWSYLHTLLVKTVWKSLCANYAEYQSVYAQEGAEFTTSLVAAEGGLSKNKSLIESHPHHQFVPPVLTTAEVTESKDTYGGETDTAKMTIEVPAEYTTPASLPVLRINSVSIELDSTQFLLSSSDGEGEPERDQLFTEDSDLSSSHEGVGSPMVRRDSDTSDVSSTDGSTEDHGEDEAPEVAAKIISQVESMFSDEHLGKDGFLLKHVRRRSDGFVSLKLVAGLRKVKQISREFPVILSALQKSDKLEVNGEGTKIRRVEPLTPYLKSLPIASQKNKEKELLSKSPSSSGDDLPGRNANGTCLHFPNGFPLTTNDKENKRQNGRNGKVTRNNKECAQKQQQQQQQHQQQPQHKQQLNRSNNFNSSNNNSSNIEREIILRRRGGSLPITMAPVMHHQNASAPNSHPTPAYLSPNSSPPNRTMSSRPKSNSYCEGLVMTSNGMSPWLQRRKAASEGNVVISSVIRQPRGPDGTRGFSMLPRPPLIPAN